MCGCRCVCVCVRVFVCVLSWIPEPVVTNSFEVLRAPGAPGVTGSHRGPRGLLQKAHKEKSKQAITPRMNKPFLHLWLQPSSSVPETNSHRQTHTDTHTHTNTHSGTAWGLYKCAQSNRTDRATESQTDTHSCALLICMYSDGWSYECALAPFHLLIYARCAHTVVHHMVHEHLQRDCWVSSLREQFPPLDYSWMVSLINTMLINSPSLFFTPPSSLSLSPRGFPSRGCCWVLESESVRLLRASRHALII